MKYEENKHNIVFEDGPTMVLSEASDSKYDRPIKKYLYNNRIKNNKVILNRYDEVKKEVPYIKNTFINKKMYKEKNVFIDLSYYFDKFYYEINNSSLYVLDRGVNFYFDFIERLLESNIFEGYSKTTIFIDVPNYFNKEYLDYKSELNTLSVLCRVLFLNPAKVNNLFKNNNVLFLNKKGYFTVDFKNFDKSDLNKFKTNLLKMGDKGSIILSDKEEASSKAKTASIIDKISSTNNITINNLTGNIGKDNTKNKDIDIDKERVVDLVKNTVDNSSSEEDAIDALNDNEELLKLIDNISIEDENNLKTTKARSARMMTVNDRILKKTLRGKIIDDLSKEESIDIPSTAIPIDSINDSWQNMSYTNFNKIYDLDSDIIKILLSFKDKSVAVSMLDISVESTSTSEDYIDTYTAKCEDEFGQRFTLKFDIPKLINNSFMKLRGNEKTISSQLVLIPVSKTDTDTAQIVSNYNKIFLRRYGSSSGKSNRIADLTIKALNKKEISDIKISVGDNIKISNKFDLPIDYIDFSTMFNRIETKSHILYFNQEEIRELYPDYKFSDRNLTFVYSKKDKKLITSNNIPTVSREIFDILSESQDFVDTFNSMKPSTKYAYSRASILRNDIPLIVILGYSYGLLNTLEAAEVVYKIQTKRPSFDISWDFIKFKDAYILYEDSYSASLLMNGLKECDTANYFMSEINSNTMWFDFLDKFGGRILADGLDNFKDLMMDPITVEVCDDLQLPNQYLSILIYANNLLADSKYVNHTDITSNRLRSNELIAAHTYKVLASSYASYKIQLKRTRKNASMTVKRTAIIDSIMTDPTSSDLSTLNPLLELEAANTVSFKGISGMNSDRSYSLDKRTFDDSMLNRLSLSTGFGPNTGISRQATLDMDVKGKRGYIGSTTDSNNITCTKALSATEALNPFVVNRDDPFRTAMTFVQTSKHTMRTKVSTPQLITTGADEALPYLTSDVFSFKAKQDGVIKELVPDEYMIVQYKDGTNDFVDISTNIKKNSDGGFYIILKLDTDLKQGSKIKKNDILAYDKSSYSKKLGNNDTIAFNTGTLAKVAILTTDEGFEDSTIISEYLSDAMSSEIVLMKTLTLPKETNILSIVKKGQDIQEGEPLIVFQNAFEDEDVNALLKTITDEEELVSDLGRIPVKSKITGVVQDIHIYRTVETDQLSDSLKSLVNKYEKPIKDLKKKLSSEKIDDVDKVQPTYALENTGKLKNAADSVFIEFYLKYEDKLGIGDKIVATNAAKGVIKDIFPEGKEPTSVFRPEEQIHAMFATSSFNARMITSTLLDAIISKGIIELDRAVKDIMGVPYVYLNEMDDE